MADGYTPFDWTDGMGWDGGGCWEMRMDLELEGRGRVTLTVTGNGIGIGMGSMIDRIGILHRHPA